MDRTDERRRRQPPQSRRTDRYERERPARRPADARGSRHTPQRTRRAEYDAPRRRQYEYEQPRRERRDYAYEAPRRRRQPDEYEQPRRDRRRYEYETPRRRPDYDREMPRRTRPASGYDIPQRRRDPYDHPRQSRRRRETWAGYILPALLLIAVFLMTVVMMFWPRTGEQTQTPTDPTEQTQAEETIATEPPTQPESKPPVVTTVEELAQLQVPDYVEVWLIDVDGTSRRGVDLDAIHDIVIHYVGNPGTEAWQNREYYAESNSEVSSHFVVGLEGEIIQCIPLNEKSSASNHRNADTISIEVCHPDASGKFTRESYESVVKLTAWLVERLGLDVDNVIRHYEVTGKICPKYYVENETAWIQFKADVAAAIG